MKYKYIPKDLAVFFNYFDLSLSQTDSIVKDMFENHKDEISFEYRNDVNRFYTQIRKAMLNIIAQPQELDEAQMIFNEFDCSEIITDEVETDYFGSYFKFIRLKLLYQSQDYTKLKLKTLINDFGYKVRTQKLIKSLTLAINALGLETYKRDYIKCNIADVKLDDTIIIRLKVSCYTEVVTPPSNWYNVN